MIASILKVCSTCGTDYPPTLEFFKADHRAEDGLRAQCRNCHLRCRRPHRLITRHNRRARAVSAEATLTYKAWRNALAYFGHRCAVCGRADFDDRVRLAIDHWIPLCKGGGSTPTNIVPLCDGKGGCNDCKGAKLPADWLTETFGAAHAAEILARIDTYFSQTKEQSS